MALLWRVRIDLRRKFALGTMLCLSVFTIITAIVKVSGGNTNNGQIDSSWVIFWLQIEAAVAVMVVSITAYRALFIVERSRAQESPRYISRVRPNIWDRSRDSHEVQGKNGLPGIPAPTFPESQTFGHQPPYHGECSTSGGESETKSPAHSRDPSQVTSL